MDCANARRPLVIEQRIRYHVSMRLGTRARTVALAALSVVALGLTACGGTAGPLGDASQNSLDGGLTSEIEQAVSVAMELSGSTEAIVGVWQGEDSAYVQGFGDGVSANTKFRGAQATQPVICALLLDLVDQGRLTLDREVAEDLPNQVGIEGITYGQLCTAKSGLADFKRNISQIFANNPTRAWAERELFAQGQAASPLSWPGLDVHISDTNAILLSRGLHALTGLQLGQLLEEHVFSQAGMRSSSYPTDVLAATTLSGMTGLTRQFTNRTPVCDVDAVAVPKVSPSMLAGAGATVTTVTDLKNFYTAYLAGEFGGESASVVTEASLTKNPERDKRGEPKEEVEASENSRYWAFGMERVGPLYGLSGSMTGTISAAYHDPESGLSVVVALNNSSTGGNFARALAFELAALSGADVPWSAEAQVASMEKLAVCR